MPLQERLLMDIANADENEGSLPNTDGGIKVIRFEYALSSYHGFLTAPYRSKRRCVTFGVF
jgi:hypothetical protein